MFPRILKKLHKVSQIFNNNMFHIFKLRERERERERERKGVEICAFLSIFLFVILSCEKYKLANSIVTFTQRWVLIFSTFCTFKIPSKKCIFWVKIGCENWHVFCSVFSAHFLMWNIRQRIICFPWAWKKKFSSFSLKFALTEMLI